MLSNVEERALAQELIAKEKEALQILALFPNREKPS
jgi:hypothetical protein